MNLLLFITKTVKRLVQSKSPRKQIEKGDRKKMFNQLDELSVKRMQGVHPDLKKVADYAAGICPVNFVVTEGLRTKQRQEKLVAEGKSKTMNSRHIGGFAIDVAAKIEKVISWDIEHYFTIAKSFKDASEALDVPIRWGGNWEVLSETKDLKLAQEDYVKRCRRMGTNPLIDGVHFELYGEKYK